MYLTAAIAAVVVGVLIHEHELLPVCPNRAAEIEEV